MGIYDLKEEIALFEKSYKKLAKMNSDDETTRERLMDKRINLLQHLALQRKKLIALLSEGK